MKKQLASVSRTRVRTTPKALFIILLLGFNAVMTAHLGSKQLGFPMTLIGQQVLLIPIKILSLWAIP